MNGLRQEQAQPRIWTVLSLINWSRDYLDERGFAESRLHAELMLAHVLGLSRLQLYLQFDRPLIPSELSAYRALFTQRLAHVPLQYILGETMFMDLPISVGPGVLIPRPETELLVEQALMRIREQRERAVRVLDVGAGSGNIALALARHAPHVHITSIDISREAVTRSEQNASRLGISGVTFVAGDIFDPGAVSGRFDMVVSNPPYIARDEFETLMPEVRLYEPRQALTDEADGFGFLTRLASRLGGLLSPQGWFLCEIGIDQAERAMEIARNAGFVDLTVHPDYAGIPRILEGRLLSA